MPTVLFSAPYMLPFLDRFGPVLERYGLELITPVVRERLQAVRNPQRLLPAWLFKPALFDDFAG